MAIFAIFGKSIFEGLMEESPKVKKRFWLRFVRIFLWIIAAWLAFLFSIILLLNIPAVQTYVTDIVSKTISNKTGTEIRVGGVKIAFPKTVRITDVFAASQQADTLLYLEKISINVDLFNLLRNKIKVHNLEIEGLTSRISRKSPKNEFNFQFIIDAFASGDTLPEPDKKPGKPWIFDVRNIELRNISATYYDDVVGINALLDLGELSIEVKTLDLKEPDFQVDRIDLINTTGFVEMWNVQKTDEPDEKSLPEDVSDSLGPSNMPGIGLGLLCLENIRARFVNKDEQMDFSVDLGNLEFSPEKIDLNKQELDLGELFFENSTLLAAMALSADTSSALPESAGSAQNSLLPDWKITMDRIELANVNAKFDDVAAPKTQSGLDYGHLKVDGLNLETGAIAVSPEGATADIIRTGFQEQCGLNLKKLAGQVEVSETMANLQNLEIETSESKISGDFKVTFQRISALQTDLGQTEISLDLKKLEVNTNDIFLFAPGLATDSLLGKYKNENIIAKARADGKINHLNIENLDLWLFDFTKLKTHGRIEGLPEIKGLGFDLTLDALSTHLADISPFLDTAILNNPELPELFLVKGTASGTLDDLTAKISIHTTFGDISAGAFYQRKDTVQRDTFNIDFEIKELMAGRILKDTIYENLSLSGNLSGTGAASDSIAATAHLLIQEAGYNNYSYQNIEAAAKMNGDVFEAEITSGDPNIRFDLKANADLRQEKQSYSTRLQVDSLNLAALHFMKDELIISTTLLTDAHFTSTENLGGIITATNTKLTHGNFVAPVNLIELDALFSEGNLEAGLKSDLLDATLKGNVEPQQLPGIMLAMLNQYFGITGPEEVKPGNSMSFNLDVHLTDPIKKLISDDFDLSDIKNMNGFYNSNTNQLSAEMLLDNLVYNGVNLDTLQMKISGENDSLSLSFDFKKINYDTITISNFSIRAAINDGTIHSEVKIADTAGNPRYLFANIVELTDTTIQIGFLQDGLIMNGEKWTVEKDNFIKLYPNKVESENFAFTSRDQLIGLDSETGSPLLTFRKFDLLNILDILEFKRHGHLLQAKLDGEIAFPGIENQQQFHANLAIDSLFFLDTLAGNFSFSAETDSSALNLEVLLKNDQNQVSAAGTILNWSENPEFDIKVLIDLQTLAALERFTMGNISGMSGKVLGNITISGTPEDPDILGSIGFEEAALKVNSLNFHTRLRNEKLTFDKNGLLFSDFKIEDARQQKLTINGSILTQNYSDFDFDLRMVTTNLQPVNSTAADNKTFYGDLFIDTDITLKGNPDAPVVDATIKINKGTNLTYALPGSELQLITPEGIIHFVDHSAGVDSATIAGAGEFLKDSIISRISGIDLTTNLEINEEAKFTVLIDPRSGDYLTIGGKAILSLAVDPGGNQTITGIYEVKSGVYQLSFYGLVKKTFTLQQGSNISWSGKPMDASLNIVAAYEVTTNSVSLVANETSSMSESEKNIYKQRLPYTVLLNINGFLAQPEISFKITLPDKYMINYPQVASKLGQLNTEEMESERNKQVFALLVTGGFIADNPFASTGSTTSSIATTAARNSVNGILADQMNNISSKYVKNVDLNFGLTSYEDYSGQSSEVRTELEVQVTKRFFDDRLTIEAQGYFDVEGSKNNYGGQSSQTMWGEFAVIYALNARGEYKLRAYRENAYDFFDGEVAYSGIAFIFEKEFDNLKRKSVEERNKNRDSIQPHPEGLKNNEIQTEKE